MTFEQLVEKFGDVVLNEEVRDAHDFVVEAVEAENQVEAPVTHDRGWEIAVHNGVEAEFGIKLTIEEFEALLKEAKENALWFTF